MTKDILKFIIFGIVVAILSVSGTFLYLQKKPPQALNFKFLPNKASPTPTQIKVLSPEEVGKKTVEFLNKYKEILTGGREVSLINVNEESGVYKVTLKIGDQEFPSFVTKDGKILFPGAGIEMEKFASQAPTPTPKKTCDELKKEDKPILEAFVVSKCPFGLQMQRILNEIVKNIPALAENIKVKYIGSISNGKITSMHGDEEAQENLRQICIREEQGNKYWSYIDCHIKEGKVEECLKSAGIDEGKLNECQKDPNRGLKYAQEDFKSQEKYKADASPTLILNGEGVDEFDFGGRTAEAVKTLICCGFTKRPEFCSKKLTEVQAATHFSPTYSKGSSQGGGSCQ
jgi:hypothetical protein